MFLYAYQCISLIILLQPMLLDICLIIKQVLVINILASDINSSIKIVILVSTVIASNDQRVLWEPNELFIRSSDVNHVSFDIKT